MAKAVKVGLSVPQPPVCVEGVRLELTMEEAQTLLVIMGKIGGSPHSTRRGLTNAISNALYQAGLAYPWDISRDLTGGLTFIPSGVNAQQAADAYRVAGELGICRGKVAMPEQAPSKQYASRSGFAI